MELSPCGIIKLVYVMILLCTTATGVKLRRKRSYIRPSNKLSNLTICNDSKADASYDSSLCLIPGLCPLNKANVIYPSERIMDVFNGRGKRCPKSYSGTKPPRVCPHYYILNFDTHRIPSVIFEARCSCTGCLTEKGASTMKCVPVEYYRYVHIKKSKDDGSSCYTRRLRAFAVGCQCIGNSNSKRKRITTDS